jgi:2',3'-cyclic-nucleotide 2'-phosphodiesterase/3'-nucleotidase
MMHPHSLGALQRRALLLASAVLAAGCATPIASRVAFHSTRLTRLNLPRQRQSAEVDLVVAATTDTHGRLRSWDYYANAPEPQRGLTRLATIVDSLRGANPGRVVLVDAGDLLQGNPLTYVAARVASDSLRPHPVAGAMNVMAYDAAVIGNHEFNYGLPTLRRMMADARFPMLAANAFSPNGQHVFISWKLITRQGVKIAIIGATTPGSNIWDRDNLAGRIVVKDIVPSVRESVRGARAAGADVVIVLLHSGLNEPSSYDTVSTNVPSENVSARVAHEVPGIDLIVFGHSHKELADSVIDGTLLMQPKNWATSLGVATLHIVRDGARGDRGGAHGDDCVCDATDRHDNRRLARGLGARRRYAAHRFHSRRRA